MLKILVVLALVTLVVSQSTRGCSECKDKRKYLCKHPNITKACDGESAFSGLVNLYCPMTCGTCEPCKDVVPRSCVPGSYPCEDNSRYCTYFKLFKLCTRGPWAFLVQEKCKKSCNTCKPKHCRNTISARNLVSTCSDQCHDELNGCKGLAERGFCLVNEDVKRRCQSSCGECIPCRQDSVANVEEREDSISEDNKLLSMMAKMTKPHRTTTEAPKVEEDPRSEDVLSMMAKMTKPHRTTTEVPKVEERPGSEDVLSMMAKMTKPQRTTTDANKINLDSQSGDNDILFMMAKMTKPKRASIGGPK